MRGGVAALVEIPPGPPLGVNNGRYDTHRLDLHPGDRLLMVTDGFLERNAAAFPIIELLERSTGRHSREVVRGLARELLGATGGDLRDERLSLHRLVRRGCCSRRGSGRKHGADDEARGPASDPATDDEARVPVIIGRADSKDYLRPS